MEPLRQKNPDELLGKTHGNAGFSAVGKLRASHYNWFENDAGLTRGLPNWIFNRSSETKISALENYYIGETSFKEATFAEIQRQFTDPRLEELRKEALARMVAYGLEEK